MAQIVGLDIGTRTIAGAVLTGSAKKFRLTDFFVEEIPGLDGAGEASPGAEVVPPPSAAELVQKLLSARGLEHADVIAGLDAKDCIIREIPVPFTKDEHIKKTILSEAENHFQTFDIEEVQLEYFKVEEVGDKSRVLIAAVRNSVIQERLSLLKQAGVDPLALDLDATALFNAFALTPTFDPERTTLLLDMGATSTKVLLVEKGQLKKIRAIRMDSFLARRPARQIAQPAAAAAGRGAPGGALPLPESYSIEARFAEIETALRRLEPMGGEEVGALAAEDEPIAILTDEEFDLVGRAAEAAAVSGTPPLPGGRELPPANGATAGEPPPAPPQELDYQDYLERLGIEIQRTFATAAQGVELICLTGGMSQREEAGRFLTEQFDVETVHLDFGDSFPTDLAPEAQSELSRVGAVAVGLAMKELGGDRIGFDFRKKQFRFERKFEKVKYPVLASAILTFLVFFQAMFILVNDHRVYSRKVAEIRAREQEIFQSFFGKSSTGERLLPAAENEKKAWERLLGVGGQNIPVFIPVIAALDEVSRGLREVGGQPWVENVDLKLRTRNAPNKQGLAVEGSSDLTLSTTDTEMGTRLEKAFGKPGGIFSALSSSTVGASGSVKIILTLSPQEKYLNDLRR